MTGAPQLPPNTAISRHSNGAIRLTRRFSETGSITLYLDAPELRLFGGLLTADNATEIGAWFLSQAEALDQQP